MKNESGCEALFGLRGGSCTGGERRVSAANCGFFFSDSVQGGSHPRCWAAAFRNSLSFMHVQSLSTDIYLKVVSKTSINTTPHTTPHTPHTTHARTHTFYASDNSTWTFFLAEGNLVTEVHKKLNCSLKPTTKHTQELICQTYATPLRVIRR